MAVKLGQRSGRICILHMYVYICKICILYKYFAINTSQRYISLLITRSNEYHYMWGVSRLFFFVIFIHLTENSGGYFYWCRLFLWILDINLQNFVRGYFLVLDARVALTLILIFMFILIMTLIWAFQSFCHLLESDGEGPLAPVTIKCPYCGLLTQEESFRMHI